MLNMGRVQRGNAATPLGASLWRRSWGKLAERALFGTSLRKERASVQVCVFLAHASCVWVERRTDPADAELVVSQGQDFVCFIACLRNELWIHSVLHGRANLYAWCTRACGQVRALYGFFAIRFQRRRRQIAVWVPFRIHGAAALRMA